MEVRTHCRAKETKIGNLVEFPRKVKLDYWAICGVSTNGAVPNVIEIGLLIVITIAEIARISQV